MKSKRFRRLCLVCDREFISKASQPGNWVCERCRRPKRCISCGKPLKETVDPIAKKKTGHIFKSDCLSSGTRISIG